MSTRRLLRLAIAFALSVFPGCVAPDTSQTATSLGAVPAPVLSTDPCEKDSDCAPVAGCHPARCAQLANVGSIDPDTGCTAVCIPGTADCNYNHCGCAASASGETLCALLPGPKSP
jgi:hypothetical protein